jgi:hypothetical protein
MEKGIQQKLEARGHLAARMRLLRTLTGMKQYSAGAMLGIDQLEYCKKENGYTSFKPEHLEIMKTHFDKWRIEEIQRLEDRITYLKSIV